MEMVGGWLRRQRATCGRSRLAALRWPGDLLSKSAAYGTALETIGSVAGTGLGNLWEVPAPTSIIVSIFVSICIHSFNRCYTRFGAYPNYTQINFL
jgi:hypothetical protein